MGINKFNYKQYTHVSSEYSTIVALWGDIARRYEFKDNRERPNVIIKHAFFTACREVTSLPLASIGSILNKDHATVLHATRNHEMNMKFSREYVRIYEEAKVGLKHVLGIGDIRLEVENLYSLNELRNRLIEISARLRDRTIKYNQLKEEVDGIENPKKLILENKILTKTNKELLQRNEQLNKELKRIKNLL